MMYSSYLQADVWEELCRIKDKYLKMLRVCISISRAYYSAELKALKEDQKLKAKGGLQLLICRTKLHSYTVTLHVAVQN